MDNNSDNINELVKQMRSGDTEAMGTLYEAIRTRSLSIARKYVRESQDAEDMFQDAFLKAMDNIEKFDESRDFGPWFDTVLVNTCKNWLVKKKATNFSDMSNEDGEGEFEDTLENYDDSIVPESAYDKKEMMEIIGAIIDELPLPQKEAVTLFYYKDYSVKQIAEAQEVPENAVKSRLNYARKKVGDAVTEYEKKHGIKLHSTAIIPVLMLIFFKKSAYAAVANATLAAGEAATAARAAASSGASASASAGATGTSTAGMTGAANTAGMTGSVAVGTAVSGATKATVAGAAATVSKVSAATILKIAIAVVGVTVIAGIGTYVAFNHLDDEPAHHRTTKSSRVSSSDAKNSADGWMFGDDTDDTTDESEYRTETEVLEDGSYIVSFYTRKKKKVKEERYTADDNLKYVVAFDEYERAISKTVYRTMYVNTYEKEAGIKKYDIFAEICYDYDSDNNLLVLSRIFDGHKLVYDENGYLIADEGRGCTFTYDELGRLKRRTYSAAGTDPESYRVWEYTYDENNRIKEIDTWTENNFDFRREFYFEYEADGTAIVGRDAILTKSQYYDTLEFFKSGGIKSRVNPYKDSSCIDYFEFEKFPGMPYGGYGGAYFLGIFYGDADDVE